MDIEKKFELDTIFPTPIWKGYFPEFLEQIILLTDKSLKESQDIFKNQIKNRKDYINLKNNEFGMSHHSEGLQLKKEYKFFVDFCAEASIIYLKKCGFNLNNKTLKFTQLWVQEFSKLGGGHHDTHIHWNQHVSGFYFLKCNENTSFPVFHDPRSGAQMTKLPMLDENQITLGNDKIHYRPKPGTMLIFPSYLPHQFIVDPGIEPFRFIHFNIQIV
jgi:uncharacterized protein (TIGR02466 family)